jgi:hypothetical protein
MINLEDPNRAVPDDERSKEVYRAIYRRRGSDLIFGATPDMRVLVSRFNHRTKGYKVYAHPADDLVRDAAEIKEYLEKEGYKLNSDGNVAEDGTLVIPEQ